MLRTETVEIKVKYLEESYLVEPVIDERYLKVVIVCFLDQQISWVGITVDKSVCEDHFAKNDAQPFANLNTAGFEDQVNYSLTSLFGSSFLPY